MPTPTEPGWYWWRDSRAYPRGEGTLYCVEVARVKGVLRVYEPARYGAPTRPEIEQMGGEWGPRIPSGPRLEAMRQLTLREPVYGSDFGYRDECIYCEGEPERYLHHTTPSGRRIYKWRFKHAPGCPWLRAQEKKETEQ